MAVLSDNDRAAAWADFMRELSRRQQAVACLKTDLRAALNAADQWGSDNAAAFNSALPQPARGQLTTAQKAELLAFVVRKRFEQGV